MKKTIVLLSFLLYTSYAQAAELAWLNQWFKAWELVRKDLLGLPDAEPPEMIFYDDTYVYTTSAVTAPEGTVIAGPGLYGRKLSWKKMRHYDSLTLPDGQQVPVGLMSFAGATWEGKSFFVMAAPAFWKAAGIDSKELTLDKLLIGVFLHEFTHTCQYEGFGIRVDKIEHSHAFATIALNDDIVQHYFESDSVYIRAFEKETALFYTAAAEPSQAAAKAAARKGFALLQQRQAHYLTGDNIILKELDDIFLSMEGLGQYVAVYWLMHSRGGKLNKETAINGFRRRRNQWSQEEGLALFLLLDRLAPPGWIKEQFGKYPRPVIALLEEALKE